MVPMPGETKAFVAQSDPSWAQMIDPEDFFAYLHTYEPFNPPVNYPDPILDSSNFRSIVRRQAARIVNYIRGQDQEEDVVGGIELDAFRSRKIFHNGNLETWRLGDIVHSTPTLVAQPAENFDLIYRDKGYTDFYRRYQFRRNVVYVGANDGMIHAFNGGFYDVANKQFLLKPVDLSGNPIAGEYHEFPLGSEMWAYVPYNLLPHLYWLTDPDYEHIYYVDMQPRVFDARIYNGKGPGDPVNPNGWATVMVVGMRFGGGKIAADMIKGTGPYNPDEDKAMSSAYVIFDITNPEAPPKLLAEVTFPDLGFTTCQPSVIVMRDFQKKHTEGTNQWYLVFGSGPASPDGLGDNGANSQALINGTSTQNATMYALDLVELASNGKLVMVTPTGKKEYDPSSDEQYHMVKFSEQNSIVSKPIAVDWDLDFNTDALYFGTISGDHNNGWGGKLRRILMDNGSDPTNTGNWTTDSILIDLSPDAVSTYLPNGQPITASATAGVDKKNDRWIFFGTGRFYSQNDKLNLDQQSFYGVKEPFVEIDQIKNFDYSTVSISELEDVTNVKVYQYGESVTGFDSFGALSNQIEGKQGWRMNFKESEGERNLGEAVLAGDVLTFTTYTPSNDLCTPEGFSQVYGLYYRTGTAYYRSIFGMDYGDQVEGQPLVLKVVPLGLGMTITPNIHVGRQEGSRAYIQSSTGAIQTLEQENPGIIKSGKLPWKPDDPCVHDNQQQSGQCCR
jgi:type IV pilus assembly protein PilY1